MSLSFPISSLSSFGLGQVGGGTQGPIIVQGVCLVVDQNDPPSGGVYSYAWDASDPTTLTGQVPGSEIVGLGSYAGQRYMAKDDGTVVMWLDNGTVVAPVSPSLILAGDGAVGAPSISFANSATTGFYRSAADTIGVAVAGALDFSIAANTFTALSGSTIATNTIAETTAASGVTVDGCLIKDGRAAALATASMFTSTEQTGTGAAQNIAHGLGSTPSMYWWAPSADAAGTFVVTSPSAGATNVVLTVTTGAKFYVYAIK